jgi:hypothetical protein
MPFYATSSVNVMLADGSAGRVVHLDRHSFARDLIANAIAKAKN